MAGTNVALSLPACMLFLNLAEAACISGYHNRVTAMEDVVTRPDGTKVYGIAHQTNNIVVVDRIARCVEAVIDLPSAAPWGAMPRAAVISPDGRLLYTANQGDDSISVVDAVANRAVGAVSLDSSPHAVALTPDGLHLWVTTPRAVAVLDTGTRRVTRVIPTSGRPTSMAFGPDGARSYVRSESWDPSINDVQAELLVFDTRSYSQVAGIQSHRRAGYRGEVAVTRDGSRLYMSGGQHVPTILVFDLQNGRFEKEIPVPNEALDIVLSTDGQKLYIVNAMKHAVESLDVGTGEVSALFDVEQAGLHWDTRGLALSSDGRFLAIGTDEGASIVIWDTLAGKPDGIFRINTWRTSLWDVVTSPDGNWLYAGEVSEDPKVPDALVVVNTLRNEVDGRIRLEAQPVGMEMHPNGRFLYVAQGNGKVVEIDTSTRLLTREFPGRSTPGFFGMGHDVALLASQNRLFFTVGPPSHSPERGGQEVCGELVTVDLTTGAVIRRLAFDWQISMLALRPDGKALYTVREGAADSEGLRGVNATLIAIDAETGEFLDSVMFPNSGGADGRLDLLKFDPQGANLYFQMSQWSVGVLDAATRKLARTIGLDPGHHGGMTFHPNGMAFSRDGSRGWITCGDAALIAEIDTRAGKVAAWIGGAGFTHTAIAVSPDGGRLYVTAKKSEEIVVVDTATRKVIRRISVSQ